MYINWELSRRDHLNAKRIFFRAIHACPQAKTVWMDGLQFLYQSQSVTKRELIELVDVIQEKELRVRFTMEEEEQPPKVQEKK